MPVSFIVAFDVFGRVLALVGTVWTFLILVKSMAVTHEFSLWRSLGAIILAGAVIYVILPVLSAVAIGSILRG